jgi:hypothetical protein
VKKISIAFAIVIILTFATAMLQTNANGQTQATTTNVTATPTHVQTGIWLINIQKIDLSASTYRLDFYLWFNFDSQQINASEVSKFEFINGQPTIRQIDDADGYIEYRVTGDFLKTFDFTRYPFESHALSIELEHTELSADYLIYDIDSTSFVEPTANVAGWDLGNLQTQIVQHSYGDLAFSRPVFTITLNRPAISSFIKSVLPIAIITAISLLAFVMAAEDYAQKMALGITTLLSATAFHLSLVSGIPPTGYLTLADRMMISVYVLFLFNIGSAVYLMKLARNSKTPQATEFNKKAQKILPILIFILIILTIIV